MYSCEVWQATVDNSRAKERISLLSNNSEYSISVSIISSLLVSMSLSFSAITHSILLHVGTGTTAVSLFTMPFSWTGNIHPFLLTNIPFRKDLPGPQPVLFPSGMCYLLRDGSPHCMLFANFA